MERTLSQSFHGLTCHKRSFVWLEEAAINIMRCGPFFQPTFDMIITLGGLSAEWPTGDAFRSGIRALSEKIAVKKEQAQLMWLGNTCFEKRLRTWGSKSHGTRRELLSYIPLKSWKFSFDLPFVRGFWSRLRFSTVCSLRMKLNVGFRNGSALSYCGLSNILSVGSWHGMIACLEELAACVWLIWNSPRELTWRYDERWALEDEVVCGSLAFFRRDQSSWEKFENVAIPR